MFRRQRHRNRFDKLRSQAFALADRLAPFVGVGFLALGSWLLWDAYSQTTSVSDEKIRILQFGDKTLENDPYHWFAEYVHDVVKQEYGDRVLPLEPTRGSLDTVIRIDEFSDSKDEQTQSHAIGLAQPDVIHHYISGDHPQFHHPRSESNVRALAALFTERIQFEWDARKGENKVPKDDDIKSMERRILQAETLCGGNLGSGTRVTVDNIARILHAKWTNIEPCLDRTDLKKLPSLLLRISATGKVLVNDAPNTSGSQHLVGLTHEAALVLENSLRDGIYKASPVPHDSQAYTLSWRALLVANRDLDDAVVETIYHGLDDLYQQCTPQRQKITHETPAATKIVNATDFCEIWPLHNAKGEKLPISTHPHLMLKDLDWLSRTLVNLTDPVVLKVILLLLLGGAVLISLVPGLGALAGFDDDPSIISKLTVFVVGTRRRWVVMVTIAIMFHLAIGTLIWLSELHAHALASDVEFLKGGVWNAVAWVWHYVMADENTIELKSNLAVLWFGLLKAGWAVASTALAVALAETSTYAWEIFMSDQHTVLVGSSKYARNIQARIANALPPLSDEGTSIQPAHEIVTEFLGRHFERECHQVVVLSDETRASREKQGDVDSWVMRQIVAIIHVRDRFIAQRKERGSQPNNGIRVVAEIVHRYNVDTAYALGADSVICFDEIHAALVDQAALQPHLQTALFTLSNTHEVDRIPVDAKILSQYRTLTDLQHDPKAVRHGILPIGIYRGRRLLITLDERLKEGDEILRMLRR